MTVSANEFARSGFEATSLETISEAVGVRPASLFHHFPEGKHQILDAIFHEIGESFFQVWSSGIEQDRSPADTLVAMSGMFWDYCAENPSFIGLLLREMMDPKSVRAERFRKRNKLLLRSATEFFRAAQAAGKLRTFDPQNFIYSVVSYVMLFHAAPGLGLNIWPSAKSQKTRQSIRRGLLDRVRAEVRPLSVPC